MGATAVRRYGQGASCKGKMGFTGGETAIFKERMGVYSM
jgi:hypothetical protein